MVFSALGALHLFGPDDLPKLQAELQEIEQKLNTLSEDLEQQLLEKEKLLSEKAPLSADARKELREINNKIRQKTEDLSSAKESYKKFLPQYQECERLKEQSSELYEKLNKLLNENLEKRSKLAAEKKSKIEEIKKQHATLSDDEEALEQFEEEIKKYQKKIKGSENKIEDLKEESKTLKEEKNKLKKAKKADKKTEIEAKETEIKAAEREKTDFDNKLKALKKQKVYLDLKKKISETKKEIEKVDADYDTKINELDKVCEQTNAKLVNLRSSLNSAQENVAAYNQHWLSQGVLMENFASEIKRLQRDKDDYEEYDRLKDGIHEIKLKIATRGLLKAKKDDIVQQIERASKKQDPQIKEPERLPKDSKPNPEEKVVTEDLKNSELPEEPKKIEEPETKNEEIENLPAASDLPAQDVDKQTQNLPSDNQSLTQETTNSEKQVQENIPTPQNILNQSLEQFFAKKKFEKDELTKALLAFKKSVADQEKAELRKNGKTEAAAQMFAGMKFAGEEAKKLFENYAKDKIIKSSDAADATKNALAKPTLDRLMEMSQAFLPADEAKKMLKEIVEEVFKEDPVSKKSFDSVAPWTQSENKPQQQSVGFWTKKKIGFAIGVPAVSAIGLAVLRKISVGRAAKNPVSKISAEKKTVEKK